VEVEDMLFAIRERDARWVRRLLAYRPALIEARDAAGKALSDHAAECGSDEIARLLGRDGPPTNQDGQASGRG
jgi:hypothetical protein